MESKHIDIIYKELSARMIYGLKVQCDDYIFTFDEKHMGIGMIYTDYFGEPIDTPKIILSGCYYGSDIKPYLFPLSSMTEEQEEELIKLINTGQNDNNEFMRSLCRIEFYHKHHFDYRGLIEKGLAIDATGLNIY